MVAEQDGAQARALYTLNSGSHWEYKPDDREYKPVNLVRIPGSQYLILDSGKGRVMILDSEKTVIEEQSSFPDEEDIPTNLQRPHSLSWTQEGTILVADTGNNRILELNRQLGAIWVYGGETLEASSPIQAPLAATRLADGNTAIIDSGSKRVIIVSPEKEVLRQLGTQKELPDPSCLFRRGDDPRLWVGDASGKILCYDEQGTVLRSITQVKSPPKPNDLFGSAGTESLSGISGLYVDPEENILLSLRNSGRVLLLQRGESVLGLITGL